MHGKRRKIGGNEKIPSLLRKACRAEEKVEIRPEFSSVCVPLHDAKIISDAGAMKNAKTAEKIQIYMFFSLDL